jgi:hypothetical protein
VVECKICNREFKSIKSLSQHLAHPLTKTTHCSSTKEYYNIFLKDSGEGICKIDGCNNTTIFVNLREGYLDHCSHKCYNLNPDIRKIRSESNKNRVDSIETRKKMSVTREKLWKDPKYKMYDKNIQKSKSEKMKIKWKDPLGPYGKEWRKAISKSNIEKLKNGTHPFQTKYFKEVVVPKRSEKLRNWLKNGGSSYLNSFNRKFGPSKPQIYIFNIVKEKYFSAEIDYPYLNFYLDIVIPEHKIVIEYDGGWWHQNEEYDNFRQNRVEEDGWKFIRYKGTIEKDFYPTEDQILEDIFNKI